MSDERSKAFWQRRTAVAGPRAARFHSDHDPYDLAVIGELADGAQRVLDLGCGTCVIPNLIVDRLGVPVHGVDYIAEFLGDALDDPRLTTEVADLKTYTGHGERYDLVLLLGVIMYIAQAEARRDLYRRCAALTTPAGALLVKAQFGVQETVEVDGRSDALGDEYRATYPQIDREAALLREFYAEVEVTDPYPPELNPWKNTHNHHLIARGPRTA
jgi:trans-aconitate methyltransferase